MLLCLRTYIVYDEEMSVVYLLVSVSLSVCVCVCVHAACMSS